MGRPGVSADYGGNAGTKIGGSTEI